MRVVIILRFWYFDALVVSSRQKITNKTLTNSPNKNNFDLEKLFLEKSTKKNYIINPPKIMILYWLKQKEENVG